MKTQLPFYRKLLSCGGVAVAALGTVTAQTNSPAPVNPMVQAMMSLPPLNTALPAAITVELDPPVVAPGEVAYFRMKFNALDSVVAGPVDVVPPAGLEMTPSARGQVLQLVGGEMRPVTALNFRVRAAQPGRYVIPELLCEVKGQPVFAPGATLTVTTNLPANHLPARQLILRPATSNAFAGESLTVMTYLPQSAARTIEALTALQFIGAGFLENKNAFRQRIGRVEIDGQPQMAYVGESQLTALAAGAQKISVQAFTAGNQFSGPIVITGSTTIPGGVPSYTLLESEPVTIRIQPLPAEGLLPGFAGFIGELTRAQPLLSTNALRIGDALQLSVTFRSEQSLAHLNPPAPPRASGWEIFPGKIVDTPPSAASSGQNEITFAYTMIPLHPEARQTPVIPFSIFDREKLAYADRSIPALPIRIIPDAEAVPGELESWTAAETAREKPLGLAALATAPSKTVASLVPLQLRPWFFGVQLAPALALLGLWLWDRERRFLVAHPKVRRRRQARRDLRRARSELRRAAAAGDAPAFGRQAVAALQIAAAPHFPAAPRALVCGEILSLFNATERGGRTGEVIRAVFAHDEAASFARETNDAASLCHLHPELELVLEQMEGWL